MFIITDIPVGKLVKAGCIAIFGQTLPEDALLSRIALMSILGFFFLFFFVFIIFFKVFQSVLPGRKPSLTVSRNRASDYFYPGSEYFILKTQFPCYRHFLFNPFLRFRVHLACDFSIPYYIIGNTSYFFFFFIYLYFI